MILDDIRALIEVINGNLEDNAYEKNRNLMIRDSALSHIALEKIDEADELSTRIAEWTVTLLEE